MKDKKDKLFRRQ